ncbi:MAG: MerR family transcriptional regulator [Clostridia bacterium]|nr:MerR family transcriptional regulator [Clostridia bacterium]
MLTVKQVSQKTGVSVRTLHHYDAIGLLPPSALSPAGYRLYNEAALCRLQSILLFRELRFPLKEIKAMLDDPSFSPAEALEQRIRILELQQAQISDLLTFARALKQKGAFSMTEPMIGTEELEQYKAEAKARWGQTKAYAEFSEKQKNGADNAAGLDRLNSVFAAFGTLRHLPVSDARVQSTVGDLKAAITEHFYTCTDEILRGLGQMYVADERFARNIDRAGGPGTADFAGRAIAFYCAK